ncbi:putative F-box domain-containing protein [Seiridium unicorne]|uniref:F-box domain-containing protein n=1 Tax=Seiridium unicorne TaxID=138068 RepID=A0ABR2UTZ0_9PEZI
MPHEIETNLLANRLKGQKLVIPDLKPIFSHWPSGQNGHYTRMKDVVQKKVALIFPGAKDQKSVEDADPALLAARWWPTSTWERYQVMTDLTIWFGAWDEYIERLEDPGAAKHFRLATKDFVAQSFGLADEVPMHLPTNRLIRSFEGIAEKIREAYDVEQRGQLLRHFDQYIDATRIEIELEKSETVPSLERYWEVRTLTSGMGTLLGIFALQVKLPMHVITSAAYETLWLSTVVINSVVNDLISLRKEMRAGSVLSSVAILFHESNDLDLAVQLSVDYIRQHVELYDRTAEILLCSVSNDAGTYEAVSKVIDLFRMVNTGNLEWSADPDDGSDNAWANDSAFRAATRIGFCARTICRMFEVPGVHLVCAGSLTRQETDATAALPSPDRITECFPWDCRCPELRRCPNLCALFEGQEAKGTMSVSRLPPEILIAILEYCVVNHYNKKNDLLELRTVCRLFDDILKPYGLHTLQVEYTRLDRLSRSLRQPSDAAALERTGMLCRALYLDMMLIRDEGWPTLQTLCSVGQFANMGPAGEVEYLGKIFGKIPAMKPFVEGLYDRYCMNEASFTEAEYREHLGNVLEKTPNVEAVRLNLPFQLISKHVHASTMLLGNTFEAFARRPEDSMSLKTLVLENLTDIGIVRLWRNPQDVKNIIDTFADLEHLLLSVRRHEGERYHTIGFQQRLWEMIGKAGKLKSLCLISLNMDELPFQQVKRTSQRDCTLSDWNFRSIPTIRKPPKSVLPYLASLELRRVDIQPCGFLSLFKCFGNSLKELILNHVYRVVVKTTYNSHEPEDVEKNLWIGYPNVRPPPNHRWIAMTIRELNVQLRVCRVTNIGYDQYLVGLRPLEWPRYDLYDPAGRGRSLDQRFVEVATGIKQPTMAVDSKVEYWPEEAEHTWAYASKARPRKIRRRDWDAVAYLADVGNNNTSCWQKTIDGYFPNINQYTVDELHRFADTACEGMEEVNRLDDAELDLDNADEEASELPEEAALHPLQPLFDDVDE